MIFMRGLRSEDRKWGAIPHDDPSPDKISMLPIVIEFSISSPEEEVGKDSTKNNIKTILFNIF
jgi:hypothetical protein